MRNICTIRLEQAIGLTHHRTFVPHARDITVAAMTETFRVIAPALSAIEGMTASASLTAFHLSNAGYRAGQWPENIRTGSEAIADDGVVAMGECRPCEVDDDKGCGSVSKCLADDVARIIL